MTGRGRAVSEGASVGVLLGMVIVVTASVGLGVVLLDVDSDEGINANFTYEFSRDRSVLLITPASGDTLPAGKIDIESRDRSVTWAEVAGMAPTETVEPGGLPIQLSKSSAWGKPVSTADTVELYYVAGEHNRTLLDAWSG